MRDIGTNETVNDEYLYDIYSEGYARGRVAGDDDEHARAKRAVFEFGLARGLRLAQQIVAGEDDIDEVLKTGSASLVRASSLIEDMTPLIEVFEDRALGRIEV